MINFSRTIISCMSPVITVNCILALAERGYGEDKGMASLLCAATSIDDVHIVALYAFCYSAVFSHGLFFNLKPSNNIKM